MAEQKPHPHDKNVEFGKDIAFGFEQTLACVATDFIDANIGANIQKKYGSQSDGKEVKYAWAGEIAGEIGALIAFIGMQRFIPQVSNGIKIAARKVFSPIYHFMGKRSLHQWAEHHHLDKDSAEYKNTLEEWKDFQADSLAKSSIIAVTGIALNVGTQKIMGNKHNIGVIVMGKLVGAFVTVAAMLGVRAVVPRTMEQLDSELSTRYFAPAIRWTQHLFGAGHSERHAGPKLDAPQATPASGKLGIDKLELSGEERDKLESIQSMRHGEVQDRRREETLSHHAVG